jgi:hypothetical protein
VVIFCHSIIFFENLSRKTDQANRYLVVKTRECRGDKFLPLYVLSPEFSTNDNLLKGLLFCRHSLFPEALAIVRHFRLYYDYQCGEELDKGQTQEIVFSAARLFSERNRYDTVPQP